MTFRLKFSITKGWHFLFRSKYLLIVTIFISGSKYYEHSSTIYTTVHHPPPILANLSPNDKHQWMLSYWVVVNTLYKSTLSTLNDALIQDIHAWNLVAPLSPCFSEFKLTLLLCQFLISADVSFIFFFFFFLARISITATGWSSSGSSALATVLWQIDPSRSLL